MIYSSIGLNRYKPVVHSTGHMAFKDEIPREPELSIRSQKTTSEIMAFIDNGNKDVLNEGIEFLKSHYQRESSISKTEKNKRISRAYKNAETLRKIWKNAIEEGGLYQKSLGIKNKEYKLRVHDEHSDLSAKVPRESRDQSIVRAEDAHSKINLLAQMNEKADNLTVVKLFELLTLDSQEPFDNTLNRMLGGINQRIHEQEKAGIVSITGKEGIIPLSNATLIVLDASQINQLSTSPVKIRENGGHWGVDTSNVNDQIKKEHVHH